jgi:hypothetical protein
MRYWEIVQTGGKIVGSKPVAPPLPGPRDIKLPGRPIGHAERGHLKKAGGVKSSR